MVAACVSTRWLHQKLMDIMMLPQSEPSLNLNAGHHTNDTRCNEETDMRLSNVKSFPESTKKLPAATMKNDVPKGNELSLLGQRAQYLHVPLPKYRVDRVGGADHCPLFRAIAVWYPERIYQEGIGNAKSDAKRAAARALINILDRRETHPDAKAPILSSDFDLKDPSSQIPEVKKEILLSDFSLPFYFDYDGSSKTNKNSKVKKKRPKVSTERPKKRRRKQCANSLGRLPLPVRNRMYNASRKSEALESAAARSGEKLDVLPKSPRPSVAPVSPPPPSIEDRMLVVKEEPCSRPSSLSPEDLLGSPSKIGDDCRNGPDDPKNTNADNTQASAAPSKELLTSPVTSKTGDDSRNSLDDSRNAYGGSTQGNICCATNDEGGEDAGATSDIPAKSASNHASKNQDEQIEKLVVKPLTESGDSGATQNATRAPGIEQKVQETLAAEDEKDLGDPVIPTCETLPTPKDRAQQQAASKPLIAEQSNSVDTPRGTPVPVPPSPQERESLVQFVTKTDVVLQAIDDHIVGSPLKTPRLDMPPRKRASSSYASQIDTIVFFDCDSMSSFMDGFIKVCTTSSLAVQAFGCSTKDEPVLNIPKCEWFHIEKIEEQGRAASELVLAVRSGLLLTSLLPKQNWVDRSRPRVFFVSSNAAFKNVVSYLQADGYVADWVDSLETLVSAFEILQLEKSGSRGN